VRGFLAESPAWDEELGGLWYVDADAGLVHGWRPDVPVDTRFDLGMPAGFVVPRVAGGILVGAGLELLAIDADGSRQTIAELPHSTAADLRINDGKADPSGRLWFGTTALDEEHLPIVGAGALYCLRPGGSPEQVLDGISVSNGPAFPAAGDRMYYTDSWTGRIDAYPLDRGQSLLGAAATFARLGEGEGYPDGMTVDAEDHLWVASFEGSSVRRFDPDGRLDRVLETPVSNPTSVVFGGEDFEVLFVTSGQNRLTPSQLADQPDAGYVLWTRPGVRGVPTHTFGG